MLIRLLLQKQSDLGLRCWSRPFWQATTVISETHNIALCFLILDYNPDHLSERSMEEVYYLWQLAGGDLEGVLKKAGLIKVRPPVTILPRLVWYIVRLSSTT